jgi:hypothetical protein
MYYNRIGIDPTHIKYFIENLISFLDYTYYILNP